MTGGKGNKNSKNKKSNGFQKNKSENAKTKQNFQEQLVVVLGNPGVLITECVMYTGGPDGPDGRKYGKTIKHRGSVSRSSKLPQLNVVLRTHITAVDHDIMNNFKTYTIWCTLKDLRDIFKVYNFICHPDLLKHTNFKDMEKLLPFSILTTKTNNNRPVAIKMIKQTAIDIKVFVYTCKHDMSKHIIKDSKIFKLLHADLESKGVAVFVEDINKWVKGLPVKSSAEVLWKHHNDEHTALLGLLFNYKVPNGWLFINDSWNNNAVVNIVKNNISKENVSLEFARMALLVANPINQKPSRYSTRTTTVQCCIIT